MASPVLVDDSSLCKLFICCSISYTSRSSLESPRRFWSLSFLVEWRRLLNVESSPDDVDDDDEIDEASDIPGLYTSNKVQGWAVFQ